MNRSDLFEALARTLERLMGAAGSAPITWKDVAGLMATHREPGRELLRAMFALADRQHAERVGGVTVDQLYQTYAWALEMARSVDLGVCELTPGEIARGGWSSPDEVELAGALKQDASEGLRAVDLHRTLKMLTAGVVAPGSLQTICHRKMGASLDEERFREAMQLREEVKVFAGPSIPVLFSALEQAARSDHKQAWGALKRWMHAELLDLTVFEIIYDDRNAEYGESEESVVVVGRTQDGGMVGFSCWRP